MSGLQKDLTSYVNLNRKLVGNEQVAFEEDVAMFPIPASALDHQQVVVTGEYKLVPSVANCQKDEKKDASDQYLVSAPDSPCKLHYQVSSPKQKTGLSLFGLESTLLSSGKISADRLAMELYGEEEAIDTISAFIQMQRGDFDGAKRTYQLIIDDQQSSVPDKIEALVYLGCICMFLEELDFAKDCFKKSLDLDTEDQYSKELRSLWFLVFRMYLCEEESNQLTSFVSKLIEAEKGQNNNEVYQIRLQAIQCLSIYRSKKDPLFEEDTKPLDGDLKRLIKSIKKKQNTSDINDTYIIIGLGLVAIGKIEMALSYLEKIEPLVYCREGKNVKFDFEKTENKRKHLLYYLYQSKNNDNNHAYADCIESSFKGLSYYRRSAKLMDFLTKSVSTLLKLALTGEDGYTVALSELAKLIKTEAHLLIIASLPEYYGVSLSRDLIIYLGSQFKFYEAQELTRTLNVSSDSFLNRALRYEQAAAYSFFYEELNKADGYYQQLINQYSTDKKYSYFKFAALLQQYIIALALNKDQQRIEVLRGVILTLSKEIFDAKRQKEIESTLSILSSDDDLIDMPIGQDASTLLESKGLILFFRRQYELSKSYFIHLKKSFPNSSSIKRWDIYIARICIKNKNFDDHVFNSEIFKLKDISKDHVDVTLFNLIRKYAYEGQTSVSSEFYYYLKELHSLCPDYEPVLNWYEKVSEKYLEECEDEFFEKIITGFLSLKDTRFSNLFDVQKKTTKANKKHLLGVVVVFFRGVPAIQKKLIDGKIKESDFKSLLLLLSNKIPKQKTGFLQTNSNFNIDIMSSFLESALHEWGQSLNISQTASEPFPIAAASTQSVQEFKEDSKWTSEQEQFYMKLRECLNDEFTVARFIADGRVVYPAGQTGFEAAETLALAGTQVPGLGSASMGLAIALKTIKIVLSHKNEVNAVSVAKKVKDFAGATTDETLYLSSQMACIITGMFSEQINRLTSDSLVILSKSLSALMVTYIATDFGKATTLGSWLYEEVVASIQSMWEKMFQENFDKPPPQLQDKRILLLPSLFCKKLTSKTALTLKNSEENVHTPWSVEGILMSTAVKLNSGSCYLKNGHYPIYGYRFMPNNLFHTMVKQLDIDLVEANEKAHEKGLLTFI